MSILSDHIDDIIDTLLDEAEDPQAVFDMLCTSLDVAASSRGLDTVSTEATLRRLIETMTERAAELQQQAVDARSDDIGTRRAECAAGVRQARALVERALSNV